MHAQGQGVHFRDFPGTTRGLHTQIALAEKPSGKGLELNIKEIGGFWDLKVGRIWTLVSLRRGGARLF